MKDGLYAITSQALFRSDQFMLRKTEDVLAAGASVLQYRDKNASKRTRQHRATLLHSLCQQYAIPFVINDDISLASRLGAGIHLGQSDESVETARSRLGADTIIGASCYNDLNLAMRAQQAGASYVAFGAFFPSRTKPGARRAPLSLLSSAKRSLSLPIVAIGGISPENSAPLVTAGANCLAVIDQLFDVEDTAQAARRFVRLFEEKQT